MNRVLAASLLLSAAAHAAVLSILPFAPVPLRGLGLGAARLPPAVCRMRWIPIRVEARERPEAFPEPGPPPLLEAEGAGAPADPAGAAEEPWPELPPVALAAPDQDAAKPDGGLPPLLSGGDLAMPLPARPPPARLPIRIEDVRWNRRVADRIGPQADLPPEFARLSLHGTVRLVLLLSPDGRIRDLRVADPGPHPALALAAQAQVRSAAPFPAPPEGMDPRHLRIRIHMHY